MSGKKPALFLFILASIVTACRPGTQTVLDNELNNPPQPALNQKIVPINWTDQTIQFEHLSIEDGLSQSVVNAMLQDHLGFMWFGTQDGLNRYDGYELKIFKNDPEKPGSICNNFIQALYEDPQGILWVGTFGGGLNRYDPKTERFSCYLPVEDDPQSISHPTVSSIVPDPDGTLWLGTNGGGLSHFDPISGVFKAYNHDPGNPESISDNVVLQLALDRNGKLWAGTMNGGLNLFEPETGKFTRVGELNNVQSLRLDRNNRLWLGSVSEGLAWIDTNTFRKLYISTKNGCTP